MAASEVQQINQMLRNMPSDWQNQLAANRNLLRSAGASADQIPPEHPDAFSVLLALNLNNRDGVSSEAAAGQDPPDGVVVPDDVKRDAMQGVRDSYKNNYGGYNFIGVARAIQLVVSKKISKAARNRMRMYFDRKVKQDRLSDQFEAKKGKRYWSWLNWGGDAGARWSGSSKFAALGLENRENPAHTRKYDPFQTSFETVDELLSNPSSVRLNPSKAYETILAAVKKEPSGWILRNSAGLFGYVVLSGPMCGTYGLGQRHKTYSFDLAVAGSIVWPRTLPLLKDRIAIACNVAEDIARAVEACYDPKERDAVQAERLATTKRRVALEIERFKMDEDTLIDHLGLDRAPSNVVQAALEDWSRDKVKYEKDLVGYTKEVTDRVVLLNRFYYPPMRTARTLYIMAQCAGISNARVIADLKEKPKRYLNVADLPIPGRLTERRKYCVAFFKRWSVEDANRALLAGVEGAIPSRILTSSLLGRGSESSVHAAIRTALSGVPSWKQQALKGVPQILDRYAQNRTLVDLTSSDLDDTQDLFAESNEQLDEHNQEWLKDFHRHRNSEAIKARQKEAELQATKDFIYNAVEMQRSLSRLGMKPAEFRELLAKRGLPYLTRLKDAAEATRNGEVVLVESNEGRILIRAMTQRDWPTVYRGHDLAVAAYREALERGGGDSLQALALGEAHKSLALQFICPEGVRPLVTKEEYGIEGGEMNHCVFNMKYYIKLSSFEFAFKASDGTRATLELLTNGVVSQFFGPWDKEPSPACKRLLDKFLSLNKENIAKMRRGEFPVKPSNSNPAPTKKYDPFQTSFETVDELLSNPANFVHENPSKGYETILAAVKASPGSWINKDGRDFDYVILSGPMCGTYSLGYRKKRYLGYFSTRGKQVWPKADKNSRSREDVVRGLVREIKDAVEAAMDPQERAHDRDLFEHQVRGAWMAFVSSLEMTEEEVLEDLMDEEDPEGNPGPDEYAWLADWKREKEAYRADPAGVERRFKEKAFIQAEDASECSHIARKIYIMSQCAGIPTDRVVEDLRSVPKRYLSAKSTLYDLPGRLTDRKKYCTAFFRRWSPQDAYDAVLQGVEGKIPVSHTGLSSTPEKIRAALSGVPSWKQRAVQDIESHIEAIKDRHVRLDAIREAAAKLEGSPVESVAKKTEKEIRREAERFAVSNYVNRAVGLQIALEKNGMTRAVFRDLLAKRGQQYLSRLLDAANGIQEGMPLLVETNEGRILVRALAQKDWPTVYRGHDVAVAAAREIRDGHENESVLKLAEEHKSLARQFILPPGVRPLVTKKEYKTEGDEMRHCVFSMGYYIKMSSFEFAFKAPDGTRATLELGVDGTVRQFFGPKDSEPSPATKKMKNEFLSLNKENIEKMRKGEFPVKPVKSNPMPYFQVSVGGRVIYEGYDTSQAVYFAQLHHTYGGQVVVFVNGEPQSYVTFRRNYRS